MAAISTRNHATMKWLIENGADIMSPIREGPNAGLSCVLLVALGGGDEADETVASFIKHGANINAIIETGPYEGYTAVAIAIFGIQLRNHCIQ